MALDSSAMIRMIACAALLALAPAVAATESAPIEAAPPAATETAPLAESAPTAVEAVPVMAPRYQTVAVRLQTSRGPIVLRLEVARAPVTTANFLRYVDSGKLDGISFFRSVTFSGRDDLGLVQAGLRDPAKLLPPIAHESTVKTGLVHDNGAISMARAAPGSAQADFFIIIGGLPSLDANPEAPGDNQGYAVFGHVVEGMDVVHEILRQPIDAGKGEGVMKGQMLAAPVVIRTVRRLPE